jgi:hypothetical protein
VLGDKTLICLWTLSGLIAFTLIAYMIITIARVIKNMRKPHDIAEVLYPGNQARQSNFRDKVASDLLRRNADLKWESREFKVLYQQEMDRLFKEYRE